MSASSKSILISYVLNIILINLLYVVLALRLVNRYKQLMVNRFSVYDSRNNMVWLRFVQVFSLLVPLLFVLSSFLYLEVIHLHVNPGFSLNLGLTLLSFVVGYFGYNQSSVFPHKSSTLEGRQPAVGKAYTKSGMGSEGEVALMDRISQFVVRDKAFLDPELTIYRIGEVLEVPHYHVTQAINRVEGKNFYTYINALRVAEVKRKMQAGEAKQYTLLALALDCGFASKTTFNTVFKKLEGVTPTQYKKEISNLSGQK